MEIPQVVRQGVAWEEVHSRRRRGERRPHRRRYARSQRPLARAPRERRREDDSHVDAPGAHDPRAGRQTKRKLPWIAEPVTARADSPRGDDDVRSAHARQHASRGRVRGRGRRRRRARDCDALAQPIADVLVTDLRCPTRTADRLPLRALAHAGNARHHGDRLSAARAALAPSAPMSSRNQSITTISAQPSFGGRRSGLELRPWTSRARSGAPPVRRFRRRGRQYLAERGRRSPPTSSASRRSSTTDPRARRGARGLRRRGADRAPAAVDRAWLSACSAECTTRRTTADRADRRGARPRRVAAAIHVHGDGAHPARARPPDRRTRASRRDAATRAALHKALDLELAVMLEAYGTLIRAHRAAPGAERESPELAQAPTSPRSSSRATSSSGSTRAAWCGCSTPAPRRRRVRARRDARRVSSRC